MPLLPGLHDGRTEMSDRPLAILNWPRPLNFLAGLLSKDTQIQSYADEMSEPEWGHFLHLVVERHRVAPMVSLAAHEKSIALPDFVHHAIRLEARENGIAAIEQRHESLRLRDALEAVGIAPVWLKGWPLAEMLYGELGLRHSNDIDILVPARDRVKAASCLITAGYVAAEEHRTRARLLDRRAVEVECKDVQFYKPDSHLIVELHWQTSHFPGWPNLMDLDEEPVPSRNDDVIVPGPIGQLIYLSGHAVQHIFSRLKWLLDVARLADQRGAVQLEADLARAEGVGAGRATRLALNLAGRVFGCDLPSEAYRLRGAEARWADRMITDIADPRTMPGELKARLGFYAWHLRMAEGPAQIGSVLRYACWRHIRLGAAVLIDHLTGRKT